MNELLIWQLWTFVGILVCSNGYFVAGGFATVCGIVEIIKLVRCR